MWPLDRILGRSSTQEYLRVGRSAIERWQALDGALTLVANHPLNLDLVDQQPGLLAALRAVYARPPEGTVSLLLESAWLPVMLVDTGATLLRAAERDALVRHRFAIHHGDARDPVSAWELRIEQRAGRRHALAYGLAPRVRHALLTAGEAAGVQWAAMLPAFSWGWQRLRPARSLPQGTGWWVWTEQDRLLAMRVAGGEFVGFNPGAPRDDDEAGLLRLIDCEAARLGVAAPAEPIAVAVWNGAVHTRRAGARLRCVDVRGPAGHQISLAGRLPSSKAFS